MKSTVCVLIAIAVAAGTTHPVGHSPKRDKVDILFVIDDSASMAPKQAQLKASFPTFMQAMESATTGHAISFHIGVVTSDLGAAQSTASSNCRTGGLGARLQPLGRAHPANCRPPMRVPYIDYNRIDASNNLPAGQDLPTTFACMASVGDTGCGFEHQLEASYRALNGSVRENAGFLRSNSIVVVVYVTDEDDCSASPTTDLFDLNKTSIYGPLNSYRCTRYGIACAGRLPPYGDSGGPLAACVAAPNPSDTGPGKLFDVSRYVNFFTKAGGLRRDPNDVILAAISAPSAPVQIIVGNPGSYQPCAPGTTPDGNCAVLLQHSCVSSVLGIVGDPAVRLNQVVVSAAHHQQTSICDSDYSSSLASLGALIGEHATGRQRR